MPEERIKGPRRTCPACSTRDISTPKFCGPNNRVGFLFWECKKEGNHLHQNCNVCSFKWTCTPTEVSK